MLNNTGNSRQANPRGVTIGAPCIGEPSLGVIEAATRLADLANERMWVAWAEELHDGKPKKVPKNPATGGNAMVPTNPETYGTRAAAERRWQRINKKIATGGIGLVLCELPNGWHLVGIDLDSCRDGDVIADWAEDVIERFDTYAEISPSGTGVKLFFLMSADDFTKLHSLLGCNAEGKPLTRKTFAAGEHREVALDTARFYAVTDQRLKDSPDSLRLVPFNDVAWFVEDVGPNYMRRGGNGHTDAYAAFSNEQNSERDNTGSGYGWRFMRDRKAAGMSYQEARAAILIDENEAGEWANRSDERQLKRAFERQASENSKPPSPLQVEMVCAADVKMRQKEWLWKGHLLRGNLELLTGLPGLGKSQVQIHFMACATARLPWPDGAPAIEPVNVIMVTAEDAIDTEVVPRLKAAGADLTRVHILKYIKTDKQKRQFLLAEDLVKLEQAMAQIGNVGLICIDPITAYMGSGKMDSHKTTDVRSQLGPLKDFAERTNAAVSAITHPAKNASAKAIDHFIGSQAFIAAARLGHACFEEIEVDEDTGEKTPTGRVLFTHVKYNPHVKMPTLAYKIKSVTIYPEPYLQIETSRVVWEKDAVNISAEQAIAAARRHAKSETKEEEAKDEVVDFLRSMLVAGGGWCKQTEIATQAKALGFSDKELRTARKKLAVVSKKEDFDGPWLWGWEGKRPVRF